MQHLLLLADFSVLKPDFGLVFWAVTFVVIIVPAILLAVFAYRYLSQRS